MSTQFNTMTERDRSVNWRAQQAIMSLLGMVWLYFAFSAIQSSMFLEYDLERRIFLENRAPFFSILGFGAGWFTVHLIEAMVKINRHRLAMLFCVILTGELISLFLILFLSESYLVGDLASSMVLLVMSGALLRYSMFRPESNSAVRKLLRGGQ